MVNRKAIWKNARIRYKRCLPQDSLGQWSQTRGSRERFVQTAMFFVKFQLTNTGWSKAASTKGHITVWGKICGLQREELHCSYKRLDWCSNRPIFAARLTEFFILGQLLSFLFATQNGDFLLEKRYTTHQPNNKTIICFLVLVIKLMSALIFVVNRRKQVSSVILFRVAFHSLHNWESTFANYEHGAHLQCKIS